VVISGQPCAVLHSAIQLARIWLSGLPLEAAVLVIGVDVANHPEERFFFNSAMGDAAIAGVLTQTATNHLILASITETHVMACSGEFSEGVAISRFRAENPTAIRTVIEHCIAVAGVELDKIVLIVPHTPNNSLWTAVAELLRFPRERILTDYIGETGHMNSNDSFVHFLRAIHEHRLVGGDLALLVNPGFGGTRSCTLLQV
jgi:3-oxoacyl-[acyl-carrier-protein] synthase-3